MSIVLVTGSEGSLMQSVIPKLLNNGHTVYGIDNLYRYGKRLNIINSSSYEFIRGDLIDNTFVENTIKKIRPDYIIQAAAKIYGVAGFNAYCADILGDDVLLHTNILKASIENRVKKIIYISSSMVYENCPQDVDQPVYEEMPNVFKAPYTDYGLSKFMGERLCAAFKSQYGLNYTIWRPFNIITPYEKGESDLGYSHVFADYINNIVINKHKEVPIIGDGNQIRCFTWIEEVAQAIASFSFMRESDCQTFNIGNPEPISMRDLAYKIRDVHAKMTNEFLEFELKTVKSFKNDVRVRIPDINKLESIFKWKPKINVEKSIEKCLEVLYNDNDRIPL